MGERIYDIVLPCGCMISLDKGGGLISCYAEYGDMTKEEDRKQFELCQKSWREYHKSKQYKVHEEEIKRRNE